jgi:hypothetical protein
MSKTKKELREEIQKTSPFTLVDAVSHTKVDIFEENEEQYVPFIINRALSYHPDSVLYANEMNIRPNIPKRAQFDYYLISLRPRKRFARWSKSSTENDIELIKRHYGYSDVKAKEVIRLFSREQLDEIFSLYEIGGKIEKDKADSD